MDGVSHDQDLLIGGNSTKNLGGKPFAAVVIALELCAAAFVKLHVRLVVAVAAFDSY